jgi:uncharacterized membrane protein YwzB
MLAGYCLFFITGHVSFLLIWIWTTQVINIEFFGKNEKIEPLVKNFTAKIKASIINLVDYFVVTLTLGLQLSVECKGPWG